ncbi:amidase [Stakelama tenebrarum]|uniref:Amidase n=1 Tax=Stakelama tenebrarum TaxID=2711215 RepID=A0A6G6Y301_9SPHN|nr:amidase [Sphingosinithalassobacter tenebrarum]QIG78983.1 amidase [Sphingosinithalassobacter tenebrarum]
MLKLLPALALAIGAPQDVPPPPQDASVSTAAAAQAPAPQPFDITEMSVAQLQAGMADGSLTSEAITRAYIARIAEIDRQGPTLRSVIAVSPDAIAQARLLDEERAMGRTRGPLHGIPVLVKDNIETRELPTTAGSLALADNRTYRDAPVVARLRDAGMVVLGKTNLSEWANIRSTASMSGWSAVGGLVRNPYALDRTACGSSSGSGVAVAASLTAVALGTETDGSVVCPASMNGIVGLKPTIGLVSRTHIVPISHSQDTAGPMGRGVRDVALLFSAMIGTDPADAVTADADSHQRDYAANLSPRALQGVRIGVLRPDMSADLEAKYDEALQQLVAAGAVLVEVTPPDHPDLDEDEFHVLLVELKADLDAYLATTPSTVTTRTLAEVMAFNEDNAEAEMPYFAQEIFAMAADTRGLDDEGYRAARERSARMSGPEGIDVMLAQGDVALLVSPTYGLPWLSDPVHGDQFDGPSASMWPAVSGYPHLTVPMGLVHGLPAGLSFIGTAYSEATLLEAGYAYEQQAQARVVPEYLPTVDAGAGIEGVLP